MILIKKIITFLYRQKAYFTHGHGSWTGFSLSIGTFLMVLYTFCITNFQFFREWIDNPFIFLLFAFPAYICFAVLIGRWSYNRGAFGVRQILEWKNNPVYIELEKKVLNINDIVKKIQIKLDVVLEDIKIEKEGNKDN